ncbi:MAG: hypothetical protein ACTSQE_09580 [Candidatus Heimdallarchaeaceae archaeon]
MCDQHTQTATTMSMDKCFTSLPEVIKEGQRCDIFECLFGMRTIQVRIYFYALKGPRTILEIADYIDRDRTTALRLTNDLVKKGLLIKHTEKLDKGGIRYRYSSASEMEVKELLLDTLEDMKSALEYFIDLDWNKLEEEINQEIRNANISEGL